MSATASRPCSAPGAAAGAAALFAPAPDAGAATRLLSPALALFVGLCARRRHGAADARRRAEAQGNDLGPVRRHPVRAVICFPPCSSAGRTRAGRRPICRARMVHGERASRPSRQRLAEILANLPNRFVGHGCCNSCCSRSAPRRARPDRSCRALKPARSSCSSRRRRAIA